MLVYIRPKSKFPPLHSDTIFGSIIYSISQIYPEKLEKIVSRFTETPLNPPFMVSSAFPFIDSTEGPVKFFPRIIDQPVKADPEMMKKFKKVEFIQEEIFQKWASGKFNEGDIIDNLREYVLEDNLLLTQEISSIFGRNPIIEPKNSINRLSGASENIFYATGDNYHNMGLFFMVKIIDSEFEEYVHASLKFLQDRGFGRDISTGGGQFSYEIQEIDLEEGDGDRFVTLSRYIPSTEELEDMARDSWFEIGSKRGRSSSGEIRKQIRFFQEGSTFKHNHNDYYGRVVESGEKSLEYGLAYTFNLK
ncbi:type III-A CRISPR-associated RAMP protein Csm4 [Sediminibacterium sp.]|uniref:type III-A CRISPR-associated RAMP protein Csm4 n=1 Tax=Sediminibacterium sp. TaxID=1917865 RepID=UPI0027328F5A|nr:type III-A CRISPR-associated RAMP protein Csm4 [Sediminibacterium sp.]MDP3566385.1 type III-A CRISPR-associated RAMP protein Csm4 [Sediminibacterium sp.]